ncbi:MAG: carboxy-S-adenosyl-L-methionine synthase CmoA [Pseudomonadota bacterium]
MAQDRIFETEKLGDEPFRFDDAVARVFPDMLRRSIPGYAASLEAIGSLAGRFVSDDTACYDLGCSLGGATLAMRQGLNAENVRIIAVDNAPAMTSRLEKIIEVDDAARAEAGAAPVPVDIVLGDLRDTPIERASMVVLNYTLQFVPLEERDAVIERIAAGLVPGGVLVLSEKVVDEDPRMESLLVDLYHEHKRRNNYSAKEIARKRAALENVLVPETISAHRQRLERAGFEGFTVWLRYFNFVSMIATRP